MRRSGRRRCPRMVRALTSVDGFYGSLGQVWRYAPRPSETVPSSPCCTQALHNTTLYDYSVYSHFADSRFAERRVSFSFHHFHFKFLSLMRYNLFMGVNETHVKILPLLCQLGLVLRLGSV